MTYHQYFVLLKLRLVCFRMFIGLQVMEEVGVVKVLLIALKTSFLSSDGFLLLISRGGFSI